MAQDRRIATPFSRRRFLQYTGGSVLGGSLLAACAGTGGGGGSTGSSSSSLPALTQWYHQYGETGTHEAVLKYAKDYTKAKVTVNWVPGVGSEYQTKLNATLLGSNPPDVFELPNATVDQVKAGALEPLDDIIASAKSDFNPAVFKPYTIQGKIYGIKMINDPTFFYYRKSVFQKAGVQPPTTMDELINVVKKVNSSGMKGAYIGPDGGLDALHQIAIWAAGGDLLSEDNTKVTFNTDRVANMFLKIHELNATGGVLPNFTTFWWDPSAFTQGVVAMQWCGLWAMPGITKALGDDFGIFPLPPLDSQSQPATVLGGWAEMVSAKSKNVEAAKEYVKYLWIDNAQVQKDWNVAYGFHVPPRTSTAASTDKLKTGTPAQAVDILNKYGHAVSPYWDGTMDTALMNTVSTIVKSGGNAKALLDKTADQASTELAKLQ